MSRFSFFLMVLFLLCSRVRGGTGEEEVKESGLVEDEAPVVVFAHGFRDFPHSFWRFRHLAKARGWETHAIDFEGANGEADVEELADQLEKFVGEEIDRGKPVHLVGFSLGGIVSKEVVRRGTLGDRVASLTTLGSPHRGTFYARLLPLKTLRDLRPGSEILLRQERFDWAATGIDIVNVWTPTDTVVQPARNSQWEGVTNRKSLAWVHPLLLWRKDSFRVVTAQVEGSAEPKL